MALGCSRSNFPSQSSPQSIITCAPPCETSNDVCMRCRRALVLIQRCRAFQRRSVAELFTKVRGADDATHDFRVSRFWDVGDEHDFFWGERFAQVVGDTCFQFGCERAVAVCVLSCPQAWFWKWTLWKVRAVGLRGGCCRFCFCSTSRTISTAPTSLTRPSG